MEVVTKIETLPRNGMLVTNPSHPDVLSYALAILNTGDSVEKSRLTFEAYDLYKASTYYFFRSNLEICAQMLERKRRKTEYLNKRLTFLPGTIEFRDTASCRAHSNLRGKYRRCPHGTKHPCSS